MGETGSKPFNPRGSGQNRIANPVDLIDNIQGSFENLSGQFFNRDKPYAQGNYPEDPAIARVLSTLRQANWNKSFPYTFAVTNSGNDLTPFNGFSDFPLPINPNDITQEETFAINIRPTQGGTIVNHYGNKYKELVISGTTGIAPLRGAGGVNKRTGTAIFQPRELRFASGYEVFIRLRNYFKAYYEVKKSNKDENTRAARLVFKNFKDGEFLIIEVPKFTMKRNSSRPHLYDYTITAKVLGSFEFEADGLQNQFQKDDGFFNVLNSALENIDIARGILLRNQDIIRQIEATIDQTLLEPLRRAGLAAKALIGVGLTLADVGPRILRRTLSTLDTVSILLGISNRLKRQRNAGNLDPRLNDVEIPSNIERTVQETGPEILLQLPGDSTQALELGILPNKSQEEVFQEQNEALELPRSFYVDLKQNLERIRDNALDAFNFNNDTIDEIFDRTPTFTPESTRRVTDAEFEVLSGLERAIVAMNQILSTNVLFKSSYSDRIEDVNERFDNEITLRADQAVREIIVPTNTTLERLALQELGDAQRWGEIVELNNLKPPYIVQNSTSTFENVVKPGDRILVPQPIRFGFGTTPNNRETFLNSDLTELEKNLGIDLRLSPEYDLILTNRNDLDVIRGTDNAVQAILLKLSIAKGEILDHPNLGIGLQIGQKAPSLVEVQSDLLNTLVQDPRFESLEGLNISQENSIFRLQFLIRLKNVDIPVPVDLKI